MELGPVLGRAQREIREPCRGQCQVRPGDQALAAGPLLAGYRAALIGAGIFRADAANGFPVGTLSGAAADPTGHGTLHLAFGSVGFLCLIVTRVLVGRIAAARSRRRAALVSWIVGALFAGSLASPAAPVPPP